MKKLSELKISTAPWSFVKGNRDYEVSDSKGFGLSYEDRYELPNARLIAAAPELYEALREATEAVCCDCGDSNGGECHGWGRECPAIRWRAVLAKAAGEDAT